MLELGATLYKDVTSFCVALAADPVVNAFKPAHVFGLSHLGTILREWNAGILLDGIFSWCASAPEDRAVLPPSEAEAASLLSQNRMLLAFLTAVASSSSLFDRMRYIVAEILMGVRDTVEDYHKPRSGADGSSVEYQDKWGNPNTSPAELRARFLAAFPGTSDDPLVTGAFFPGMKRCRPDCFSCTEVPELGLCAKNYQDVHKHFSPGTFTVCCACAHPKMIGFVVLNKREGPAALLNAILAHFALLPDYVVYDFGCGALRSALGKLRFFLALVVLVSDLFHVVNHLCSDALHPRSYSGLDGKNSVAHEQRNSPINLMRRTLRACGQDEYMTILQLETIFYNVMAHARSTYAFPLPEEYNYKQFYFSQSPCCCGCGYQPAAPELRPAADFGVPDAEAMNLDDGLGQ